MIILHRYTFGDDSSRLWLCIEIKGAYYVISDIDLFSKTESAVFYQLNYGLEGAQTNEVL